MPEFELLDDYDYDQAEHDESDEEQEPMPSTAELLDNEQIFSQVAKAIELTKETGREQCLIACFDPQGEVVVNKPFQGGEDTTSIHQPAVDPSQGHPEGQGFHLPEDHTPFLVFHTHPSSNTDPSLNDLYYFHSVAEQNYNISGSRQDDRFWVNPVNIIANDQGDMRLYQYSPDIVLRVDEEMLEERIADAVIEIGQKLGVKKWGDEKMVKTDDSSFNRFMVGERNGEFGFGFPKFVVESEGSASHVHQAIELKESQEAKYSKLDLLKAAKEFEVCQEWQE